MTTQINLNQTCRVVLQQRGVDGIRDYYHGLDMDAPDYSVGDVYEAPLWEIMSILGTHCFMGPVPPFETTFEIDPLGVLK